MLRLRRSSAALHSASAQHDTVLGAQKEAASHYFLRFLIHRSWFDSPLKNGNSADPDLLTFASANAQTRSSVACSSSL